jgi:2-oxoglutarate dehydrogenase E2 component (dihydrolipoamide succinyltransferase)
MPQLGESVEEGTITKWLKSKGEQVEEYEPLLEINTDKVDSEIPSPAAGKILEIVVPEGKTVRAGELLAWIGEADESVPEGDGAAEKQAAAAAPQKSSQESVAAPVSQTTATAPVAGRDRELGFISPVVAKIAGEEGIDLYKVTGTGRGGRITKKDVLAYLEQRVAEPEPAPAIEKPEPEKPAIAAPKISPAVSPGEVVPLTPVRRSIAEHMVSSKRTSPHVTTVMEADLSRVVAHRNVNKARFEQDGAKLTFTPYFVAASVAALQAYPVVNSSWGEDGIVIHPEINIGMATSLGEAGLIVPVIKNAESLSLLGLARQVNDLANRARSRQLNTDEVKGGTFTITNHGISGSLFATPIINQPQCAILGVGAIQKRVVVLDETDAIAVRSMAYISLTFDHRILDGAIADYFLARVVKTLEEWA